MLDPEPLIIVGSSVRAAAQSAKRAGFAPWCVDQFGDRDLAEVSTETTTIADWPSGIAAAFETAPHADWLFTGALENDPELIGRLSESQRLLGCGPDVLKRMRDPGWLAHTLKKASLPSLPVIVPSTDCGTTNPGAFIEASNRALEQWILKPRASAAGINVCDFDEDVETRLDRGSYFLQKKANGRSVSGLYLGAAGSVQLLGLCEQLCRGPDAGMFRYVYSGSLGPLSTDDIPQRTFYQAQQIGTAISNRLAVEGPQIKGLFGIDFILDEHGGDLWTLEVNPRYPASTELYERAFGWPMIKWHVEACRRSAKPTAKFLEQVKSQKTDQKHGKQILYARQDIEVPDIVPLVRQLSDSDASRISVADIPHAGSLIRKDEPVCTIFTAQKTLASCRETLLSDGSPLLTTIEAAAN